MSTFDYQEMIDTVRELLTEFGKPFRLRRREEVTGDPVEGTVSSEYESSSQRLAVLTDINEDYATRWAGSLKTGDRALLMEPGVRPIMGDTIELADGVWTVQQVDVIGPDETDLVYEILVRP